MNPTNMRPIKIFADGADLKGILALAQDPRISGFTTNPTLMRKSGVHDYEGFAHKVLDHVTELPVCFEVFSDDVDDMYRQARLIAGWCANGYVKIPITNTKGDSTAPLVRRLSNEGLANTISHRHQHSRLSCAMKVGGIRATPFLPIVVSSDTKKGLSNSPPEMRWIDYGLNIVTRDDVPQLVRADQESDLPDLYSTLSRQGDLVGYEVTERFDEIGSREGLADLEDRLAAHPPP